MDPGSAAHRKCAAQHPGNGAFFRAHARFERQPRRGYGVTDRITPIVVMGGFVIAEAAESVIARFGYPVKGSRHHPRMRAIQYSGTSVMESIGRGVLDTPPARGTTALGGGLYAFTLVVPAKAGIHNRRCQLLRKTSTSVQPENARSMGPCVRRDDDARSITATNSATAGSARCLRTRACWRAGRSFRSPA
jgi:hypothetical protein